MYATSLLVLYIRNPELPYRAGPRGQGDAEEGMPVSPGIMRRERRPWIPLSRAVWTAAKRRPRRIRWENWRGL
jgi:hypothetical protein